ncbi:ExeA family protein [Trichlorobacter ammonificans]|uniref:Type II secretion system protein A n=1 Tax=Trichlorobacter ammonificans TaxID=2916410 RepID=A0ABN8HL42_9BACT|nr:AAA family ATPase [Trichlorobacter ammonificans]CAH2032354.1 Type II secretion system protein A [Trichlorobacter ammonificans]
MTNTSYLAFYSLLEDPFALTPDPAYYYPSGDHANALLSLDYIMNNREGFCLLTGEPGTGKTTLVRIFVNKWLDKAEIALIMTPRLNPQEFLEAILQDLEVIYPLSGNKNDMIKEFRDFLLEQAGQGRRVVIIVDEAQQLPDETMEELRLLSNLETEKEKLLQIILVGQPELTEKLASNNLRQLNQRISVRARLSHLSEPATADYLTTRLQRAGARSVHLFDQEAIREIHRCSNGIPRLINLVASRSLMVAYLEGKPQVQRRQVEIAAKEIMHQEQPAEARRSTGMFSWRLAALLLALAVAVTLVFLSGKLR